MSKIQKKKTSRAKQSSKRCATKAVRKRVSASTPNGAKKSRTKRVVRSSKSGPTDQPPQSIRASADDFDPSWVYRARMQLVGGLLNTAFESVMAPDASQRSDASPFGAETVDRVGQGAYLQIMGQVFAALFDLSQAISTDDLVKLSRIVAEQRRAETSARKLGVATAIPRTPRKQRQSLSDLEGDAVDSVRQLPESFGDIVQQIYGVSVSNSSIRSNGQVAIEDGETA